MKKVIIVGGGIAGLTAGVYAQKYGFSSEIFEQHTITGGQCTGWNRQGYHIDNCIHWLTGTNKSTLMYQLWNDVGALGEAVEVFEPDSFEVYEFDGEQIKIYSDADKLRNELLRVAPEDREQIEEFMNDIITLKAADMPADKPVDLYSQEELASLEIKMKDVYAVLEKYAPMSCRDFALRFSNPLLQKAFSYVMPCAQSMIFSIATVVNGNGDIPVGGSLAMAERMRKKYISLRGKVHTGKLVTEILTRDNRATGILLEDGTAAEADYVITACDVSYVFDTLLKGQYHDAVLGSVFEEEKQHPGRHPVPTSTQVAIAVDMDMKDYPLALIFATEKYRVGVTDFYTLGWRNYSYEPNFAPKGKTVLNIFMSQSDQDYFWWKELYQDKEAYKQYKESVGKIAVDRLIKRFPELEGKLTVLDVYTPMTFERYCNTYHGAWMSFLTLPGETLMSHNGKIEGLDNCFMSGMWLMPPGGLPVAAVTGKYAVQRICECEGKR